MTRRKFINDLSGYGGWKHGSRWHSRYMHAVCVATSPALAMLEWLAHAHEPDMDEPYYMVALQIPRNPIYQPSGDELPEGWRLTPPFASVQKWGDACLNNDKWLGFEIPSIVLPLCTNILLNPKHPLFRNVAITAVQEVPIWRGGYTNA